MRVLRGGAAQFQPQLHLAGGGLRRRLRGVPRHRGPLGPLDSSVPRRALRRERAEPDEAVRARRRPDVPHPPDPEELLYHKQDDDEQLRVEPRVVLPPEPQGRASGVHQQSSPGATAEVGLGGVASSATSQARGPYRRAGALGEEGADSGGRHREFSPAEGDPLVERALPIYELTPGSKVEGSRTSSKLLSHTNAARRAKYAVADFPQDPADLWRIKMRPEPGYISLVSFGFELVVRPVVPFPDPISCVLHMG